MGRETYTPNHGPWVELPPPKSKDWDFADRVGSLVYRINPNHLSYWNPDVAGRGFLFLLCCLGAVAASNLVLMSGLSFFKKNDLDNLQVLAFMAAWFAVMAAIAAGTRFKPLPPPTYFNRDQQKVMQYYKPLGKKGQWFVWNWADVTPAIRQTHISSGAGRSTMYVLVLMKIAPSTNQILDSFGAYTSEALKLPCVQAWEYMRRYMNEPPERVPPAYIPPFGFDRKTCAVRCQIESMQVGLNPDGTFQNWFARLLVPIYGTAAYAPMWATLWIEKAAPKVPLPPEIEALNRWDDTQPNPYKIEHAYGGPDSEHPVTEVYERIKLRHWVMTAISFGFYCGVFLMMIVASWIGTAGR